MVIIEGREYMTVKEFAEATGKDRTYIYHLATYGNTVRTLKATKVGSALLILASEATEFPFKHYRTKKRMDALERGEV